METVINTTYYTYSELIQLSGTSLKNTENLPHIGKLIDIIYSSYQDDYAFWIMEGEDKAVQAKKRMNRLQAWLDTNAEKISASVEAVSSPSHGESKSSTRFNDTPQNTGTFEDDQHTTNYTEYKSSEGISSDYVIQLNRMNLLAKYRDEFAKNFIISEEVLK